MNQQTQNTIAWFSEHNVQIVDEDNTFKPFYQTLFDVSLIYDSLSNDEREFVLALLCGAQDSELKQRVKKILERRVKK